MVLVVGTTLYHMGAGGSDGHALISVGSCVGSVGVMWSGVVLYRLGAEVSLWGCQEV